MQPRFIHLHLHTEYSVVDGLVRIKPLLSACAEQNMPAVAVTDLCNFFGLVKFYKAAIDAGIKPIVGADILIYNDQDERHPFSLTLLCQNQTGYHNVIKLISRAYIEGQMFGIPMVKRDWIEQLAAGIIVLSGGRTGDIGRALLTDSLPLAEELLLNWAKHFPNRFYLELQRTGRPDEESYIQLALDLACEFSIPVVATNDVRFITQEDFEAHEARVCIHDSYVLEDAKRPRLYSEQQYLRSEEEMVELFRDIPSALENSVEIAKRCNLELSLGQAFLPNFPVPQGKTIESFFAEETIQGLAKRVIPNSKLEVYKDRLQYELEVINQMGFAGYFLIVADFIHWAKEHDIPVGPGRGSGAGSLVAYALQITDVDPIEHNLLFERFLNPERVSMPDFDIDFCMEGRDQVIEYVAKRYGRNSVSQIITFGTMAARAVVRDVGRVLGLPYGYVDKIAKLIPYELGITLKKALQQEERLDQLYKEEDEVKTLIDLALKLEGLIRSIGKHAGGVVIAPSELTDFTPLYCEENGKNLVSQFDKNDVEEVGLVKFDFLGLRTLTIIKWALQTINAKCLQKNQQPLDIAKIPIDDEKTYDLLKSCATTAVFQIESRGMRDLTKRLQPNCFEDILALVALFRPGPLQSGMVEEFIERKYGRARVEYPHPDLKPILSSTYGVILYQEQVMQIAQVLAGYSLGAADVLRSAMGKKKPEEMAKQRAVFIEGAAKRRVDKHLANNIFDLMEKFAGYGFNRSHSAGYTLITYQTAWLKTHYPAEYMAAVLSSDMDNTDKVVMFVEECKRLGLKLLPPDVNYSQYKFTVNDNGEIIYGLGAIKGVGEAAIENITASRKEGGNFKSLFDLCRRNDTRKVNKRVLESLICAGALDSIGPHRAGMFASIANALRAAEQNARSVAYGQSDLFADFADDNNDHDIYEQAKEWNDEQRLSGERDTLGLYLSGHPIKNYEKELRRFVTSSIADLEPKGNQSVIIAGFVAEIKQLFTKSGKRMAVIILDDHSGRIEIAAFSEVFNESRDLLVKGQLLVVEGDVSIDEFTDSYRVQARRILKLSTARDEYAKYLFLHLNKQQLQNNLIPNLMVALEPYRGGKCLVYVNYSREEAGGKLLLGKDWQVKITDELLERLYQLLGGQNVEVRYS